MEKLNQLQGRFVHVDLIRTIAMIEVILLHAAGRWTITSQEIGQMNQLEITRWSVVDVYQSLGAIAVPLFLMLTGALLLQPEKQESLSVFFKKRWTRIGLPSLFWGVAYFAWDFLVVNIPFTSSTIIQGILNGPYTQMWYLYVLVGLYLMTPILRIFMAHADPTLIKYFVIIWVLGVAIIPFFGLFTTTFRLNAYVFTLTGYVGFFVLGAHLSMVQIRRLTLAVFMVLGIALTAIGTYVLAVTGIGTDMYFFQQYLSPTIILGSVMMFLLLFTIPAPSVKNDNSVSKVNKLLKVISQNTLAIFFIHVMIMESIQRGFFGFALNKDTLNPVIEVPLLTAIVLFASLGIILLLRKVPYMKRLIGCQL